MNAARDERLIRLGDAMSAQVGGQAVVLAYPRQVAEYLPLLSANLKTMVFRDELLLARQAGITEANAVQRDADYALFANPATPDEARLQMLARYRIRLIVQEHPNRALRRFIGEHPTLFTTGEVEGFTVYRFDLDSYLASPTSSH